MCSKNQISNELEFTETLETQQEVGASWKHQ